MTQRGHTRMYEATGELADGGWALEQSVEDAVAPLIKNAIRDGFDLADIRAITFDAVYGALMDGILQHQIEGSDAS